MKIHLECHGYNVLKFFTEQTEKYIGKNDGLSEASASLLNRGSPTIKKVLSNREQSNTLITQPPLIHSERNSTRPAGSKNQHRAIIAKQTLFKFPNDPTRKDELMVENDKAKILADRFEEESSVPEPSP